MENEIRVTYPGGKRVDAEYKGFTIKTDQPLYAGGDASAPAPFDLFLVSIATCAGIYVVSFCQSRSIPLEQSSLTMRMTKDDKTKMISKIEIEIELPPGFPEKYRNAVIKAVDQCAVKAHLQTPPEIAVGTRWAR
jgi:ribosomal protein S12 methylthiotransferase accessory factor